MRILANTGFLFPTLPFPDRIRAAAAAGFDGVEFHDEVQRHDPAAIAAVLRETHLTVGSLNSGMGATMGTAALPGRQEAFAEGFRQADAAAQAVGAGAIHVLSGRGAGQDATLIANLKMALTLTDRDLLIEPIGRAAVPDYHLHTLDQAFRVQDAVGSPRLGILFDWFHIATAQGPVQATQSLTRHRDRIAHIQLSRIPDRHEPGANLVAMVRGAGYPTLGLEYRPTQPEADTLAAIRPPAPPPSAR